jgi:hypothetical protein
MGNFFSSIYNTIPKKIRDTISKIIDKFIIIFVPLIPVILTLILPISINKIVIPYFFRPDVFGSTPWFEPSMLLQTIIYYFVLTSIVYFLGIVSCIMMSLQICRKFSWLTSAKYSTFIISWLWIGIIMINTFFLPFGKAYLLTFLRIPYSLYFVDGIMLTPFVFLGTIMARSNTVTKLC